MSLFLLIDDTDILGLFDTYATAKDYSIEYEDDYGKCEFRIIEIPYFKS